MYSRVGGVVSSGNYTNKMTEIKCFVFAGLALCCSSRPSDSGEDAFPMTSS